MKRVPAHVDGICATSDLACIVVRRDEFAVDEKLELFAVVDPGHVVPLSVPVFGQRCGTRDPTCRRRPVHEKLDLVVVLLQPELGVAFHDEWAVFRLCFRPDPGFQC